MRKLASLALAFSLALVGTAFAPQAQAAPIVLKMTVDSPVGLATDIGAREFKRMVEERSKGKYRIDQFLGQSFGSPESIYQALMMGSVHINVQTTSQLSSLTPSMQLFDCPGVFPSEAAFEHIIRGEVGKKLLPALSDKRVTFLGFTCVMPRVVWTRMPCKNLDELQNKKIRTTSGKMHIATINNLGMTAVPMPWPETFTALQQGVVDGHDSTIISCAPQRITEVAPYVVESDHLAFSEAFQVATKWWNKLPAEDRAMFQSCVDDTLTMIRKIHDEKDKTECRKSVIEQGAKIITPTNEEKLEWFARNKETYKKFPAVKAEWITMIQDELKAAGLN